MSKPDYQKLKFGEEDHRQKIKSRTFQVRSERQEQCQRIEGRKEVAKEVEENADNGKHQDSVKREIEVASVTMKVRMGNEHQSRLLLLKCKEMVNNFREEESAGVLFGNCLENRAETTFRRKRRKLHSSHLLNFGVPQRDLWRSRKTRTKKKMRTHQVHG